MIFEKVSVGELTRRDREELAWLDPWIDVRSHQRLGACLSIYQRRYQSQVGSKVEVIGSST